MARKLDLPLYRALTENVHEYCSSWVFDVHVVTAKARPARARRAAPRCSSSASARARRKARRPPAPRRPRRAAPRGRRCAAAVVLARLTRRPAPHQAFKPLPEVAPIARRCLLGDATLHVPISEAQVAQFALPEERLARRGRFLYYREAVAPSHGAAQRKVVTPGGGART